MDVCSKLFSTIMNEHAFELLKASGTPFQFGGTPELGCSDGLFTIKTLLNMRKNHNLASHVAFVDLVKAYDTANHELLLKILVKYGAPPKFVKAVETVYQDLTVVLKIEKEKYEIGQSVGVRQGDNMAPVLFLFLMSAFAETLEIEWREKGIEVVTVQTAKENGFDAGEGIIKSHTPKEYNSTALSAFEIIQCLYVDDGAFIFNTREDMKKGLDLIFSNFARFGLEMHIGRGSTSSKTECVFFPAPRFFSDMPETNLPVSISSNIEKEAENRGLTIDTSTFEEDEEDEEYSEFLLSQSPLEKEKAESEKAKVKREDEVYDTLDETKDIKVADRFVSYTKHFKYLGSYISYNLRDDYDIDARLAAASASMGALKKVWDCPHMDLHNKYLLFRAIPVNLLLWGCETWSLRQTLLNKLEVFLHRSVRRILSIKISQVKEEHIKNVFVRQKFYDIPRVRNMIAARQMRFIGKVVRGPWSRPAKRMLTACCANIRLAQRPNFHNKDLLVKNLKLLFANVHDVEIDNQGSMKEWINEVMDEEYWNQLVKCLTDKFAELPERPETWRRRRRSPRGHEESRREQPWPPTPPRQQRQSEEEPPSPPSPPRRRHAPPPRRPAGNNNSNNERDWDPEQVGRSLYDSFKILGLGLGATETEVKVAYRALSRIYHPDKNDPSRTGMTNEEASEHFKLINNANQYLRQVL